MRVHKSLIAFVLLHAVPAAAAERLEHLNYRIHHQLWGDIGTLTETISTDGSRATVNAELDIAVNLFGLRLHTVRGRWNEVWQDGYLEQFDATTLADSETETTAGRKVGHAFLISAAGRQTPAPMDVQPVNPWSVRFTSASTMMSPETGRLFSATVTDGGRQAVRLGDTVVAAHHYVVTAERVHHLYFDGNGRLVQCQYGDITGTVTITRFINPQIIISDTSLSTHLQRK